MSRTSMFSLYFLAVFLQAGAYGLTFMLPRLFQHFGAGEKIVGQMLFITAVVTLISVYFSGHLSDRFGRLRVLSVACLAIALGLFLFGAATSVGVVLIVASISLGFGWALTYSLGPVVLTRLIRPDERVRFFTLLSVFVMAGFGLSPVLAAALEQGGFAVRDAFYVTSGLCIVSAVLFLILRGPIHRHALSDVPEAPASITLRSVREVFASKAVTPVIMVFLGASVFAGLTNFQTVFADARGLNYANYFLAYTITVVVFRLILARFTGGRNPYATIAMLQYVMGASILLFYFSGTSVGLYILTAVLFGLGYGVSYPILVAMAATDAQGHLGAQTLQLFALSYFVGIFGFPLVAGWMIVDLGMKPLLGMLIAMSVVEATLALRRAVT